MDLRSRRSRETKPKVLKLIRKVQVVYYLTRNGQLQHPQYMEVTHLLNQPLCLRDVMERLTVLRGKGVPSLYSWSCKRYIVNLLSTSSVRLEDGEPVGTESVSSRSSVLLQIIARGNLAVNKTKKVAIMKQPAVQNNLVVKKGENLHRGVLCKCAVKKKVVEDHDEMINCMYENPRLGKLQAKEYFSGSIVESVNSEKREPVQKKSNSYNEERRCNVVEEEERDKLVTGKCKSSKQNQEIDG